MTSLAFLSKIPSLEAATFELTYVVEFSHLDLSNNHRLRLFYFLGAVGQPQLGLREYPFVSGGLPDSMEYLGLDYNEIETFSADAVRDLRKVPHVTLAGNPVVENLGSLGLPDRFREYRATEQYMNALPADLRDFYDGLFGQRDRRPGEYTLKGRSMP